MDRRRRACVLFEHAEPDYAYLLGVYLGDGHIAKSGRAFELRLYLDAAYPGVVVETCEAILAVEGKWARINRRVGVSMFVVHSCSVNWPVLFPQHGPGKKHHRPILLARWQEEVVAAQPRAFLRGLIHSDGSRYVARQRSAAGKDYFYARYNFSNRSEDIRILYRKTLDAIGVRSSSTGWAVDVNRRKDVAALDGFIGPKR